MYTSSAAANSENAEPSSVSSRLNASQAKPAPSAKAVRCTARKNSVGSSLIQLPQGICSSLSFGVGGVGVAAGCRPYVGRKLALQGAVCDSQAPALADARGAGDAHARMASYLTTTSERWCLAIPHARGGVARYDGTPRAA